MSSSTGPFDAAGAASGAAFALRCAAAVAYPLLAHVAALSGDPRLAALAALDLVVLALAAPLLRARPLAWAAFAAAAFGAAWLARGPHALLPLLLAPPAFVAVAAWAFARTLHGGRVPLVGRIAAVLDATPWEALPADVRAYTRRVTLAWALLLAALAVVDVVLALFAAPGGWSWFANIGDYVAIGGFMLVEYGYRRLRFPARVQGLAAFLRGMARLGPRFWREALR